MKISGIYYNGKLSQSHNCSLYIDEQERFVFEDNLIDKMPVRETKISPRIGNSSRYIYFSDDSYIESNDNDIIDIIEQKFQENKRRFNVHRWESNKKLIFVLFFITPIFIYILLQFAIPASSRHIANMLPAEFSSVMADGMLEQMDKYLFSASELSEERQESLRKQFLVLTRGNEAFQFKLYFRKGEAIGANAMALPDGSIIFTDELITMTNEDKEIQAVMLHEIGHIVHRHSLRKIIETGFLMSLYLWLTEDLESINAWITTLPVLFIQTSYSREIETEADSYALDQMLARNISPKYFADFFIKIKQKRHEYEKHSESNNQDSNVQDSKEQDEWKILDYLSTHPGLNERIQRFQDAARY